MSLRDRTLAAPAPVGALHHPRTLSGAGPMPLAVEGLGIAERGARALLRVERLLCPAGSVIGVRGPSGAGKTTFLNALAGLTTPREGVVRWGEVRLSALPEAQRDAFRRRAIGMVFQDFHLFEELGALDNAAIAAAFAPPSERAAIRRRAQALLQRFGVSPDARDVSVMSGGERQRVAVARALASDPPIILADEPTANLDRAHADALLADMLAHARARGATLIVVSHDPTAHRLVDRVLDIADGRLAG